MTSYLKSLNPVPGFPEYTGPHKVGTVDVEIPTTELDSPNPSPEDSIGTVQFRVFYPCENEPKAKAISWLPAPQRQQLSAYTKFLGAGPTTAELLSFIPRLLHYISIPVQKDAKLLEPTTESGRWPVLLFSHGLGGNRNAYSHLAGSLASHGIIVIAPEHRDGSCPITYIRDTPKFNTPAEKRPIKKRKQVIEYTRISHTATPEVEAARNSQLKIRLWEMGCIHDAILKIDQNTKLNNLDSSSPSLSMFAGKLAVHEPGSIIFGGHSFGAVTITQFIKSSFYSSETSTAPKTYQPIFTPSSESAIAKQITSSTPIFLLDVWCLPLRAASTRWLWNKPMPCYAPGGPGGCALLAVASQAFFKWRVHLKTTKRLLSSDPNSDSQNLKDDGRPGPHFYYPTASAHLSQSDFGILFPWFTRKIFASEEPERVMKLNVRAILQLLRERNIPVSPTSAADMEMGSETDTVTTDDVRIFGTESETGGGIRGWNYLDTNVDDLDDVDIDDDDSSVDSAVEPSDAVVSGELKNEQSGVDKRLETISLST